MTKTIQKKDQLPSTSQSTGRQADRVEPGIENAVALQDPFPDQGDDDRAEQDRVEEDAPEEAAERNLAVEDEGGDQGEQDHEPDLKHDELAGVVYGPPEDVALAGVGVEIVLAGEQRAEVLGAHIRTLAEKDRVASGGRVEEIEDDRQEGEGAEDDQVRQQEHPGDALHAHAVLEEQHRPLEEVEGAVIDGADRCLQHVLRASPW